MAASLRSAGINCEIYADSVKLKKQFDYAAKKGIPYMIIVGESEVASHTANVKNLSTGEQNTLNQSELVDFLLSAEK